MHWPSVLSYMISSFSIVIFNKIVLTIFEFNSVPFIMFCQSVFTIIVFILRKIPIKKPSLDLIKICTINISNVFFGISAAGALNVAMFSALRRLSIFMTLLGQWYYLKQKPSNGVIFSIFVMILGAIIAAGDDLSFNALGYGMVTINNFLTAGIPNNNVSTLIFDISVDFEKISRSLHHEIFHMIKADGDYDLFNHEYSKINNSNYIYADCSMCSNKLNTIFRNDIDGFVSEYGSSTLEEDQAEVFAAWMTLSNFDKFFENNMKVLNKQKILKKKFLKFLNYKND